MKFSLAWLNSLVAHDLAAAELVNRLTMAGVEVRGTEAVAAECSNVVVGEVRSVQAHPNADRLALCEVFDGDETRPVVCGAPNVRVGMKVPYARVGAELANPGQDKPVRIRKAKIRGVESRGMLCSAEELGLEERSEGLLELDGSAGPGTDIRQLLALDDLTVELDLTPNRGDCLGMRGLAREVSVLTGGECRLPLAPAVRPEPSLGAGWPVAIGAPAACGSYRARLLRGVDLSVPSPLWLRERLRRSGLRSIDPAVDVTNYIALEYGQPLHAFDADKLAGGAASPPAIDVRMAAAGEELELLDGKTIALDDDVLVIASGERAVAMAGIMGGAATAVDRDTRNVLLECAWFHPLAVAGRARRYGMHTEASHRYERGVDTAIGEEAMEAATALLREIAGGEAGPISHASGDLPAPARLTLRHASVDRLLGVTMDREESKCILERLGFTILSHDAESLAVQAPSFRSDIAVTADLIEEIARIYGYDRVPAVLSPLPPRFAAVPEGRVAVPQLKRKLAALGYQEIISYSFIDPALSERVTGVTDALRLRNPLSQDMSVMRSSILPALLQTLVYNRNRQHGRLRLFEVGMVFIPEGNGGGLRQEQRVAGLLSGGRWPENWCSDPAATDFHDLAGDIETLLGAVAGATLGTRAAAAKPFHDGQCAEFLLAGEPLGVGGRLHPEIAAAMEIDGDVLLFELDLERLTQVPVPFARELSRYPEVTRDLAIIVDEATAAADVLESLRGLAGDSLCRLRLFDVYRGEGIAAGKKSLALGLAWQLESRTLADDEVDGIVETCLAGLRELFGAQLRGAA